jgi:Cu+-exporting ATPase
VYRLTEAGSGAPLGDLVISHEQPMHLIVVSHDLAQFQHVHPAPTGQPGEFAIEVTFPVAGTYILYDEFLRANGQELVQRDELAVGAPSGPAALAEDGAPKDVGGDARVTLRGADAARAGQETTFTFRLEDPRTGEGIRDLQPYLGAPAHVVILSEDAQRFAHTHGEQVGAGAGGHAGQAGAGHGDHDAPDAAYGPEIAFRYTFPAPGLYKIWGQFQDHRGRVITADFVVRVN